MSSFSSCHRIRASLPQAPSVQNLPSMVMPKTTTATVTHIILSSQTSIPTHSSTKRRLLAKWTGFIASEGVTQHLGIHMCRCNSVPTLRASWKDTYTPSASARVCFPTTPQRRWSFTSDLLDADQLVIHPVSRYCVVLKWPNPTIGRYARLHFW